MAEVLPLVFIGSVGEEFASFPVPLRGTLMRSLILKIDNYLLFLATCLMLSSGGVLAFRLERQSRSHGLSVLGFSRHEWADLHFYFAIAFLALAVLHLAINWSWIFKVAARGKRVLLLSSLLVGFLILALPLVLPIVSGESIEEVTE